MANVYHIALVIWSMIKTYSVRLHMKDSFRTQMLLLWQLLMKKKRGKKTLEVKEIRYPTVPPQPNNTDRGLYIMKSFEKFLDFVNRNLKWELWYPEFSHQEILSFRREIKQTILDEISNKKKS